MAANAVFDQSFDNYEEIPIVHGITVQWTNETTTNYEYTVECAGLTAPPPPGPMPMNSPLGGTDAVTLMHRGPHGGETVTLKVGTTVTDTRVGIVVTEDAFLIRQSELKLLKDGDAFPKGIQIRKLAGLKSGVAASTYVYHRKLSGIHNTPVDTLLYFVPTQIYYHNNGDSDRYEFLLNLPAVANFPANFIRTVFIDPNQSNRVVRIRSEKYR